MVSLTELQEYKNQEIVFRFTKLFDIEDVEAELIFEETKKWLWLCAKARIDRKENNKNVPEKIAIDDSLVIIDEMWHNFILFTKDYNEFCENSFGFFIHHFPTPKVFNDNLKEQIKKDIAFQRKRRQIQYEYIYDLLGADTLKLWYDTFAEKYTPQKLLKLRMK